MKFAILDQGLGIARELPLMAEGARLWGAEVASDYELTPPSVRVAQSLAALVPGEVPCFMQDKIDVKGAAAYHDEDENGFKYIRCALSTVPGGELLRDRGNRGESLFGLLLHEIGEALKNPRCDRWVQQPFRDKRNGRIYSLLAEEICDPVQEIADAMTISDGTQLDRICYVKPAWWDVRRAQSEPVDSHGALSEPLTIAPGGYQIAAKVQGESEVFAEVVEHHELALAAWRRALKREHSSRTLHYLKAFGGVFA